MMYFEYSTRFLERKCLYFWRFCTFWVESASDKPNMAELCVYMHGLVVRVFLEDRPIRFCVSMACHY